MYILCRKLADGKMVRSTYVDDDVNAYTKVFKFWDKSVAKSNADYKNERLSDYDRQWPWYVQEMVG